MFLRFGGPFEAAPQSSPMPEYKGVRGSRTPGQIGATLLIPGQSLDGQRRN